MLARLCWQPAAEQLCGLDSGVDCRASVWAMERLRIANITTLGPGRAVDSGHCSAVDLSDGIVSSITAGSTERRFGVDEGRHAIENRKMTVEAIAGSNVLPHRIDCPRAIQSVSGLALQVDARKAPWIASEWTLFDGQR